MMASIRVHEDQENRMAEIRRGKENNKLIKEHINSNHLVNNTSQGQAIQQKRAVLSVLHHNCPRSKPELGKDDKFKAKTFATSQRVEPFKIYEEKDEVQFKVYENKLEEETSVVLRETQIQTTTTTTTTELVIKSDNNVGPAFRSALQEIPLPAKEKDTVFSHESPMSLELSALSTDSAKKIDKSKRDTAKQMQCNFYEVEEYRADIYNYLRMIEVKHRPKPGYMKKQPDITYSMRSILIDWLVEVTEEYRLQTETLYLAVSYIDRFLSYMSVVRAKLQLVGTAAMFIAAKYEEIYPPEVGEFVYITDDTYTKKQVLRMEHLILRVLSFDLSVPTPLVFLRDYCISHNLPDKMLFLAMYLCELSMLEADPYLQFPSSHLAAAALAVARHQLEHEAWPHELELSTGYSIHDLRKCIGHLCQTFANAPNNPQQAIQQKYKSSKYAQVALILPHKTSIFSYEDDSESA